MNKLSSTAVLVSLAILALAAPALAGQQPANQAEKSSTAAPAKSVDAKKANLPPELLPAELRQLERMADLYEEYAQQMAEAQTRIKVIQEMQQRLTNELNSFQAAAIAARGYKPGEAALDLQQRKVAPISAPASDK